MAIWRKILSTDKNNAGKFAKNLPRCDITHKYKAMAQEIELKFIVNHDAVDALRNHLHTLGGEHHAPSQLLNIYFETPDNWLRRHDMGLRIRGENGRYEMTMKIAGRVTGGLHQRPEYNVALSEPVLDLTQLPAEVWPDGKLPAGGIKRTAAVQYRFYREKWCLDVDGSRIEIALDLGDVKAGEFAEPICELELELLRGDTRAVLKLAKQLLSQTGLRQGSLSKAARGYHGAGECAAREYTNDNSADRRESHGRARAGGLAGSGVVTVAVP